MDPLRISPSPCGGWSLVELLCVIAIISVLGTVGVSSVWKKVMHRAERIGCESNLKSFFSALEVYQADYGHWPQMPEQNFTQGDEESYWEWWFDVLDDYQITEHQWLCPTDRRERGSDSKPEERDRYESSYQPTNFDARPNTPRQWWQPWVLERADYHGDGNLMIMPDGSIQASLWPGF